MVKDLTWTWKMFKRTALVLGVILSGFAVVELINACSTLYEIHPWLGIGFILLILVLLIWSVSGFFVAIYRRPRVLIPPQIDYPENATDSDLVTYQDYMKKYLERLSENPSLDEDEQNKAAEAIYSFDSNFESVSNREDHLQLIKETENEVILPLLDSLDLKADKWIRRCVGEIMVGVTLSPFRAVDLLVVLYRNGVMIVRLVNIYNGRPLFVEQLAIFRDTLRTVATVNYLNFGEKFIELIFQGVPFIGRLADDITQGVGAGLLTSTSGHAAKYRCRAFRGWGEEEAKVHLGKMLKVFIGDVKNIFWKDVFPLLEGRIPGRKINQVRSTLTSAFDTIGTIIDSFLLQPTRRIARGGGKVVADFPLRGIRAISRRIRRRGGSADLP